MEQIREAKPPVLFVGADGPRADHSEDATRCERAREVAARVEWDCEVHTLFQEKNLGCKQAVSSAITWFFEHVEAGIILEDDCVPHPTFFPFCAELLDRYEHDERVMTISGNNFQPSTRKYASSYYFSVYPHCWGWATWKQAWQKYDGEIPLWKSLKDTDWLAGWLETEAEVEYWREIFDRVYDGEVDSWAYPWTFSCWREHTLNILPNRNLVSNVGFSNKATHTNKNKSEEYPLKRAIDFPLSHPKYIVRNYEADLFTSVDHYEAASLLSRIKNKMKKLANSI